MSCIRDVASSVLPVSFSFALLRPWAITSWSVADPLDSVDVCGWGLGVLHHQVKGTHTDSNVCLRWRNWWLGLKQLLSLALTWFDQWPPERWQTLLLLLLSGRKFLSTVIIKDSESTSSWSRWKCLLLSAKNKLRLLVRIRRDWRQVHRVPCSIWAGVIAIIVLQSCRAWLLIVSDHGVWIPFRTIVTLTPPEIVLLHTLANFVLSWEMSMLFEYLLCRLLLHHFAIFNNIVHFFELVIVFFSCDVFPADNCKALLAEDVLNSIVPTNKMLCNNVTFDDILNVGSE